jgi:hypothetical protein
MSSCPNIKSEEWQALEQDPKIGKFKAYQDYLETGGEIRTPEEVKAKLASRADKETNYIGGKHNPGLMDIAQSEQLGPLLGIDVQELKNTRAIELANKMSMSLGIEFEFLTPAQATEITKDTKNPWKGEPAFFVGGKVYFLSDRLSSDMAIHEFAHPLIRAISKENPELFNKLYKELVSTKEGMEIIQDVTAEYKTLTPDSDLFKEEVIVKALEKAGMQKLSNEKIEGGFKKFIDNLLYVIKQILRKVFGKAIKVSKLSADTSLDELADILTSGEVISIDTQLVSEEDIVAYNKEVHDEVTTDLENVDEKEMQGIINSFYDVISSHINLLMKNENYDELAVLLLDDYKRGDYQTMRSNLAQWQTTVKNAAKKLDEDVSESRNRVEALTNTLFRLEEVMTKIHEHTKDVSKRPDTIDNMHKAHYYSKFISHWGKLIAQVQEALSDDKNEVDSRSTVVSMVNSIATDIKKTEKLISEMQAVGARDALYAELEPLNRSVAERYEEMIQELRDKGAANTKAGQAKIDSIYREYHGMDEKEHNSWVALMKKNKDEGSNLTIEQQKELSRLTAKSQKGLSLSKDKLENILKGGLGDANFFNSYLEGYLYSADPVVGGLALYIKNALNEVMIVSQRKYNEFANDIRQDLKDAGYDPTRVSKLGEQTTFRDKVGRLDENGVLEPREVNTFLHEFKNYRWDAAVHAKAVDDALQQHQMNENDETEDILIKAVAKQKKFLATYFHQEYVPEFYERQKLLQDDDIGVKAAYRRDNLFERMRKITEPNKSEQADMESIAAINLLWREYSQLHSRNYENGQVKTGEDAEIAKRLRTYRDQSREFYESKLRQGVFEQKYFDFLQELRTVDNLTEADPLWHTRIEQWKKAYTRVIIKPEFYERRNEILAEIKEIMSKLPASARKELDQSEIWEEIIEITAGYRDEDGQPNANEMTAGAVDKVRDLQIRLEEIKEQAVLRSGLTKKESQELFSLYEAQRNGDSVNYPRLRELQQMKQTQGLSTGDVSTLDLLYAELQEMATKEATDHYQVTMNNWLSKMDTTSLKKTHGIDTIDTISADYLLKPEVIKEFFSQDKEFEKWFTSNHILREYYDKESGENKEEYERLYVWNVVRPTDENMMESYEIRDTAGDVIDTVQGLPSMDFYARVVKNKYKTRPQITKDNQGNFLPKSREEMSKNTELSDEEKYKYINEKYEAIKNDAPIFKVLEKLKKHHLRNQEGLSYSSRLYMDIPRYRKSELEVVETTKLREKGDNTLTLLAKRIKDFIRGGADQSGDVMSYEDKWNLVRADMFDNEMTDIPITGLYNIDAQDVSLNVTLSIMRYMHSAERQKQLVRISPVVRAIQNTVNNEQNAIKDLNKVNKQEFKNRGILRFLTKKGGENVRKQAVNNLIERELEGKTQKGFTKDVPFLTNFSNLLFKRASFAFFALNIPSALKNSLGMKFQQLIEASTGKYLDHINLQKGNVWAYKAMGELSFSGQLHTKGTKTHTLQLIDIFDPIQGRFEEKFATEMSRSLGMDVLSLSWLYSPRKWVEIQAGLQLFGGMMHKKKVKQTMPDGTVKEIDYLHAWETVDGQIRLKSGIDARYASSPTMHTVKTGDTLEGIAAKYNMPVSELEILLGKETKELIETKLENAEEIEDERIAELTEVQEERSKAVDEYSAKITEDVSSTERAKIENDHGLEMTKLMDKTEYVNNKWDKKLEGNRIKINNTEFKFYKNRIQQVQNNMGGAYAKFDQPEAQRYLAYRFISYLRRYFTTMTTNRWGFSGPLLDPKPRLNPGLGDVHTGFYITFFKTLSQTIRQGGQNLPYLTKEEKAGNIKFMVEVGMLMITSFLMSLLFGWDPEDDERYAKLRAKSGHAGFLGLTGDDPNREFDLLGFAEVQALHLLMQVRAENEQFNMFTGGLQQWNSMTDLKSVAFGPTTDSYIQLLDDAQNIMTGDPKAFYSRRVGPYTWQEKGGSKFLTHFGKTFGLTGSTLDPALAIQNFQSYQAKVRR